MQFVNRAYDFWSRTPGLEKDNVLFPDVPPSTSCIVTPADPPPEPYRISISKPGFPDVAFASGEEPVEPKD